VARLAVVLVVLVLEVVERSHHSIQDNQCHRSPGKLTSLFPNDNIFWTVCTSTPFYSEMLVPTL
jgi:hypothetical protein